MALTNEEMEKILLDNIKLKISDPILNIFPKSKDVIYVETQKVLEDKSKRNVFKKFTIEISKGWL